MGDKKKHKEKERSEEKKKSKKKSKQRGKDKEKQLKKKKSQKRARSSSSSSYTSESSSSERSRDKKTKKKKKDKEKTKSVEKQQKQTINMPFAISQTATVVPSSLTTIRPGLVIPPPAPISTTATATIKPKTKQSHIFKLLPRLPIGCITVAKTIYSSSLFVSEGFENKLVNSMCEELQKTLKIEGSKKMVNVIGKVKAEISTLESKQKDENREIIDEKKFENQFEILKDTYNSEMNKLRRSYKLIEEAK